MILSSEGLIDMAKGWHQTEETKEKNRLAHFGKKASDETKRKLSLVHLGTRLTEEHKKKLFEFAKKQILSGERIMPSRKGVKHTNDSILKMKLFSGRHKGWHHSEEAKAKISVKNAANLISGKCMKVRAEYAGIKFVDYKEAFFAAWCDSNDIRWKYSPLIFKCSNNRRYVPDFMLLDSNEFVEIGSLIKRGKIAKMNEFVGAGNVLYYLTNNFELGDKTRWAAKSI